MWFKQILAAATDWRTLLILGAGIVAAAVTSNPFPAIIGLGIYLWAVQRMAGSPHFQAAAEQVKLGNQMAARYRELQQRYRELTEPMLSGLPATQGRTWKQRVYDVTNAAHTIYNEWLTHRQEQQEKAQVVEESLKLATLYIRMLRAYTNIYGVRKAIDTAAVGDRMSRNQRRLEQTMDLEARKALLQAIEMDELVLRKETDEAVEKERYLARLAAIESTMDVYRKQVFDPSGGEGADRLHEMLLEAEAMDEALDEVQQRTRVRAR